MKGFFHALAEHFATGLGIDVGATSSFWKGNTFGLVLTDATTSFLVWDNGTVERFSPELFAGIAQEIGFDKIPLRFKCMVDIALNPFGKSVDDDLHLGKMGGRYRAGLEVQYKKIALRFGRGLNALNSAGLGLDWGQAAIHYAFTSSTQSAMLGDSHLISFSLDPKWLSPPLAKLL